MTGNAILMKTLNLSTLSLEKSDISFYHRRFENLYDKYSPKVNGFLISQTDSKEQAEELLINVFLKVWAEIRTFKETDEKKIIIILLSIVKLYR